MKKKSEEKKLHVLENLIHPDIFLTVKSSSCGGFHEEAESCYIIYSMWDGYSIVRLNIGNNLLLRSFHSRVMALISERSY